MTKENSYTKNVLQISVQGMNVCVMNLTPHYSQQKREPVKQEISEQLFRIFKKYS